jgi:CheY-specific phosphatase CheX
MRTFIEDAVKNFFHETLSVRCETYGKFPPLKVYSAVIALSDDQTKYSYSLCMNDKTIKLVSSILLYENQPDEEVKTDLICECANLIVGSAKVAIEEANDGKLLQLSPPEYQGYFEEEFSKVFEDKLYFKVNDELIMIGVESVDITATV